MNLTDEEYLLLLSRYMQRPYMAMSVLLNDHPELYMKISAACAEPYYECAIIPIEIMRDVEQMRTLLMFFTSPHQLKICGDPADKEKLCVD